MKRTKLSIRKLPEYSFGEEIMNMVTHIVGGAFGLCAFILCLIKAVSVGEGIEILGAIIYGLSMVALYTLSSIYHGLRKGTGKRFCRYWIIARYMPSLPAHTRLFVWEHLYRLIP